MNYSKLNEKIYNQIIYIIPSWKCYINVSLCENNENKKYINRVC